MSLSLFRGLVVAALVLASPIACADDPPVRVRGTIERIEGDTYIVKARSGDELKVKLAATAGVSAVVKASLADAKPGTYVGIAGMPQADGSQRALEVLVFPEAMRGVAEGHRGWDLQPSSTMTNGNVDQSVVSNDGQVLTVKYKDGEKKITVPADAPIVAFVPGDKHELKVGASIFIAAATRQPDGTLLAPRVAVGRGVTPPM
jgi:uncharacterized protein YdeI (BOF family)